MRASWLVLLVGCWYEPRFVAGDAHERTDAQPQIPLPPDAPSPRPDAAMPDAAVPVDAPARDAAMPPDAPPPPPDAPPPPPDAAIEAAPPIDAQIDAAIDASDDGDDVRSG